MLGFNKCFTHMQINLQRSGGVVNGNLLKAVIELIAEIEIRGRRNYFRNFEQELIADAVNRYGNLAAKMFLTCSLNEYMEKVIYIFYRI